MKKYQYILFDWDGCLAKTLDIWLEAYKVTFAEYDLFPNDKEITQTVFGDWEGPAKLGVQDTDEFFEKLLERVNAEMPTVQLYNNAFAVVESLKNEGKQLALITTSARETIQKPLENSQLESFFDTIITAEDVTNHKPDPEPVDKAISLLGGTKEQAIIIGDSKSDLGAAQNATIDSILYYPPHNEIFYDLNMLKSYQPMYIVNDLSEILKIVV